MVRSLRPPMWMSRSRRLATRRVRRPGRASAPRAATGVLFRVFCASLRSSLGRYVDPHRPRRPVARGRDPRTAARGGPRARRVLRRFGFRAPARRCAGARAFGFAHRGSATAIGSYTACSVVVRVHRDPICAGGVTRPIFRNFWPLGHANGHTHRICTTDTTHSV